MIFCAFLSRGAQAWRTTNVDVRFGIRREEETHSVGAPSRLRPVWLQRVRLGRVQEMRYVRWIVAARDDDTPSLFGDAIELPGAARASAKRGRTDASIPAECTEELRALGARLHTGRGAGFHLGTSSWSFPGWRGLVYRDAASESSFARDGLVAYAQHPLFRSVGVDKTYYRPAPRDEFVRLAAQVPADFRFLVKAWRALVEPEPFGGGSSAAFLNAAIARREFVEPAFGGLGEKCGPLLFQFPPMRLADARAAREFLAALQNFLQALPRGPLYAVEVRNHSLVGPELGELLAETGVAPCLTVHPTMPDVETQSRELALDPTRPLVMRWMLRGNHRYEEAKDLYAPFDRIVEPDDASRDTLARLARAAVTAGLGAWVIVNNKAEGSSPRSVERLARAIVDIDGASA